MDLRKRWEKMKTSTDSDKSRQIFCKKDVISTLIATATAILGMHKNSIWTFQVRSQCCLSHTLFKSNLFIFLLLNLYMFFFSWRPFSLSGADTDCTAATWIFIVEAMEIWDQSKPWVASTQFKAPTQQNIECPKNRQRKKKWKRKSRIM